MLLSRFVFAAAALVATAAALPSPQPIIDADAWAERALMEARQAPNATSSASGSIFSTASASASGTSSAAPAQNTCGASLTSGLAVGQQASWSNGIINTCCASATASACYYRVQSTTSSANVCTIPSCTDLQSGDSGKMLGFVALSGSNGQGSQMNSFPSLGQMSGALDLVPQSGLAVVAALALGLGALAF